MLGAALVSLSKGLRQRELTPRERTCSGRTLITGGSNVTLLCESALYTRA